MEAIKMISQELHDLALKVAKIEAQNDQILGHLKTLNCVKHHESISDVKVKIEKTKTWVLLTIGSCLLSGVTLAKVFLDKP